MGYIDRTDIERFIKEHGKIGPYDDDWLPDADVTPVQHGWWIMPLLMEDGHIHGECSHCHKIKIVDDYCSACGAIMDIDLEDTED